MFSTTQIRWRIVIIAVFTFFLLWALRSSTGQRFEGYKPSYLSYSSGKSLANSTLGFQKIIAVSAENPNSQMAWRRKGLIQAANRTGLTINIEETHNMPDSEVEPLFNITLINGGKVNKGSARARAAHERVLRQIIKDQVTSALVLEDDVDWELDIQQLLAPSGNIASAIRRLSGSPENLDTTTNPYGNAYDVIWLGHCGVHKRKKPIVTSVFNITFPDPLVLPQSRYWLWDGKPFEAEGIPEGHRQVRVGSEALCTLAYAISLEGAKKMVDAMWAKPTKHVVFDLSLTDFCMDGTLRCLTVNPEVMHDQVMQNGPGSIIVAISKDLKPDTTKKPSDMRPLTHNIRYSARCNADYYQKPPKQCLPKPREKKDDKKKDDQKKP